MFTGIVNHIGSILAVDTHPGGIRLSVQTRFRDLTEGESIAVDGACLTVCRPFGGVFECDLSLETTRLTKASTYQKGSLINLERALRMGDAIGGHWVTGHVDGLGRVETQRWENNCSYLQIESDCPEYRDHLTKKGSITVNGVSLTVNDVKDTFFDLMLIPHTLEITTLKQLKVGDSVNLEFDWMTKIILSACKERFSNFKELFHDDADRK